MPDQNTGAPCKSAEKYPPPEALQRVIELPTGAAQEIAAWLDVPIRTLYSWLDGRHPSLETQQKLRKKIIIPDKACASEMRLAFYSGWWRSKFGAPSLTHPVLSDAGDYAAPPTVPAMPPVDDYNDESDGVEVLL